MDGGPFKRHGPSSNSHVLTLFEDADAVEIDLFLLLPAVLEVGEPNLVQIVLEDMNRRVWCGIDGLRAPVSTRGTYAKETTA